MATTTLKVDWDDDTIGAVRVACLAAAEVYESLGSLPAKKTATYPRITGNR